MFLESSVQMFGRFVKGDCLGDAVSVWSVEGITPILTFPLNGGRDFRATDNAD